MHDTDIFRNIVMILMPYDTDIIGIILMLYNTRNAHYDTLML